MLRDFDDCEVCYTVQFFVQLVSQQNCETSCTKNCIVYNTAFRVLSFNTTYAVYYVSPLPFLFRMCEGTNVNKAVELYQAAGELREVCSQYCLDSYF